MFEKEIKKAITFISLQQRKNGSFDHESVSSSLINPKYVYTSTFPSSLIILALQNYKDVLKVNKIITKSSDFLKSQASENYSFNYWNRNSNNYKKMPYPDDLDDTALALSALFIANPKNISGKMLAKIVSLLTLVESRVGGPYKTWLVSKDAPKQWQDVDIAVNANIAYFLHLQDISLPKLDTFLDKKIKNNMLLSLYYPNEYPVIYFISRFYNGRYKNTLIKKLLSLQKNSYWENPLYTSLAISSLINLEYSGSQLLPAIEYLVKQIKSSSWEAFPFYVDPAIDNIKYFAQSKTLTTALCVEALQKFNIIQYKTKKNVSLKREDKIHKKILFTIEKKLKNIDKNIFASYLEIKKRIFFDSQKQVSLLPYYFYASLKKKYKQNISQKILIYLGQANTYGWVAYTIYDDFLDNDANPKFLSLANISLRVLTQIYMDLFKGNSKFTLFYFETMDIIDKANLWEILHARVPLSKVMERKIPTFNSLNQLAEKSLGHILSPMALMALGKVPKKQQTYFVEFFIHYLIARQLNDDAHDWENDLKNGQVNAVGSLVIKYAVKKHISLVNSKALQNVFWTKIVLSIHKKVHVHIKMGKFYLEKCSFLEKNDFFSVLIDSYLKAMEQALEERKQAMEFLKTYPLSRSSQKDLL